MLSSRRWLGESLPENAAAAANTHKLLVRARASTGEAVPSTVTKRHFRRPTTSESFPNIGQDTNAKSLTKAVHVDESKQQRRNIHSKIQLFMYKCGRQRKFPPHVISACVIGPLRCGGIMPSERYMK